MLMLVGLLCEPGTWLKKGKLERRDAEVFTLKWIPFLVLIHITVLHLVDTEVEINEVSTDAGDSISSDHCLSGKNKPITCGVVLCYVVAN